MATHAIGKLKFNLSRQGLAYRWGDGEIKRLFGGKARPDEANDDYNEYNEDGYADPGFDDGYAEDDFDGAPDAGYADDDGYADDGYVDDDGYADDGYADDGYADGGYADDDGYADDGYADDDGYYEGDPGYDDGYADDGYADDGYTDDGYADDGYADEGDGYYDDRYSDEDAGEDYGGDYAQQSPLMQYVDENDWVTYLLLFLFPPLGIYLLWRRNRFDKPIRYAVSAASAIWFIIALILILTGIFGGANDAAQQATITLSPTTTVSPLNLSGTTTDGLEDPDGSSDLTGSLDAVGSDAGDLTKSGTDLDGTADSGDAGDAGDTEASPTPIPSADTSVANVALNASDYVFSPATGLYYHSKNDCSNIGEGVSVSRVPKDVAENNRKQSACPVCIGGTGNDGTYYATRGGSYYHVDKTCSSMTGAVAYTKEAAERAGKTPCPVCILRTQQSIKTGAVKFVNSNTKDQSNISVYSTQNGKYFHMTSDCSGMVGAVRGSLKDALVAGKTACPTCCAAAGTTVYCTSGGTYYHQDQTCSGMSGAADVSLAEAMVLGKSRCPKCIKGNLPTASEMAKASDDASGEVYVYGTANGKYYHTDEHCSGMKGAKRYTLKSMLLQKRAACPKCASASDTVVYATQGGTYYHSYATCSGMSNATSGTMAQALAAGYKRCPRCWSSASATSGAAAMNASATAEAEQASKETVAVVVSNPASKSATAGNTYVYATKEGSYYHLNNGCSGMKGASRVTLKQAINAGKKACPTCASAANRTVYSTEGGKNYHAASVCEQSGMKNGVPRSLAQALMLNQTACPYCMKTSRTSSSAAKASTAAAKTAAAKAAAAKTAAAKAAAAKKAAALKAAAKLKNSHTYKAGTSGIKVYARADSKYYHRRGNCSGMTNASRITLETALNYGKRACPVCVAKAGRQVYATRGAKYYHYNKTHAGVGAKSGSLASALAYGYKPCPYCVTKTKKVTVDATYKSGTSGIKVYATASGKYYHSKRTCSDMKNPSRITLETALNFGKKACPKCLSSAGRKVYSSSGDGYYHYYKAHAGSGAKAGTLAQARALGKRLCPLCSKGAAYQTGISTRGSVSYSKAPVSTDIYPAPGNTKVYISLTGSKYFYYHKSSSCSDAGMSHGTGVTLQYAKDWGYLACPACKPPTSVGSST